MEQDLIKTDKEYEFYRHKLQKKDENIDISTNKTPKAVVKERPFFRAHRMLNLV